MTDSPTNEIYDEAGFQHRVGYGDAPAVVVVDLQRGFTDPANPLGGDLTGVIERTNDIVDTARTRECPVVFTRVVTCHPDGDDLGIWTEKVPTLTTLQAGSEWVDLDDRLDVGDSDVLVDKQQASAFHGTELNSVLTANGVDTVLVTGCTTSGCIRATAVDACSYGYRTIVLSDAVGDRATGPHDANLFDIEAKYGDVRSTEDVCSYLDR